MGTWGMGGGMHTDPSRDAEAIEALRLGLDLGMTLIDTAEMYGAGHSEEVVSKSLEDWRKPVFVASKSRRRILRTTNSSDLQEKALTGCE